MKYELPEEVKAMKAKITDEQRQVASEAMSPFVNGLNGLLDKNVNEPRDFIAALGGIGHVLATMFAGFALSTSEEAAEKVLDMWVQVLKASTTSQLEAFKNDPIIGKLHAATGGVGHA